MIVNQDHWKLLCSMGALCPPYLIKLPGFCIWFWYVDFFGVVSCLLLIARDCYLTEFRSTRTLNYSPLLLIQIQKAMLMFIPSDEELIWCGMYPDIEKTTTATLIAGVARPVQMHSEEAKKSTGAEGGNGCKCSPCKCNPCNCWVIMDVLQLASDKSSNSFIR